MGEIGCPGMRRRGLALGDCGCGQAVQEAFNPDSHPNVRDGIATRDEIGRQVRPPAIQGYYSQAAGLSRTSLCQFMEIFDSSMASGVTLADFEAAFAEISAVRDNAPSEPCVGVATVSSLHPLSLPCGPTMA